MSVLPDDGSPGGNGIDSGQGPAREVAPLHPELVLKQSGLPERLALEHWTTSTLRASVQTVDLQSPAAVHWHEFHELFLVVAGEGTHVMNGVSYSLRRGSAALLTPFDFHGFVSSTGHGVELVNLVFDEQVLTEEGRRLVLEIAETGPFRLASPEEMERMSEELKQVADEVRDVRAYRRLGLRVALERLLVKFARLPQPPEVSVPVPLNDSGVSEPVRVALRYLHHHFSERVALAEVAALVYLSPAYFSERFHAEVGEPFQNYLKRLRVRFAASLLVCSELSVTEVCYASGFQTVPYFSRAFREAAGCSPSQYRARPDLGRLAASRKIGDATTNR
jgi:AraC-like DNA-binding protein/mannose-6-phosphate isomerase-like protein (cupin superfamily)